MATSEYVIFVDADDLLDPELCHFAEDITLSESADIIQYSIGVQDFSSDPEKVKWLEKALTPLPQMLRAPDVLKKAFVSREYATSLLGKIIKAELCKKAFAMLPEEKGRVGEDIFTYFYLAYYAKSYLGVNTKEYYIYRHGLGVTNSEVMPLSKFEMYCKMAYWPQYVHKALLSNNSEYAVQQSYKAMVVRMAQDCCNIYRNRMNPKDKLSAMKLLITYWDGIPEAGQVIQEILEKQ